MVLTLLIAAHNLAESTDDDDTDIETLAIPRGREYSQGSQPNSSSDSSTPLLSARVPFTRSKSPVPPPIRPNGIMRRISSSLDEFIYVFPADFEINISIPFTSYVWNICLDARRAGESLILVGSLAYASSKIWEDTDFHSPHFNSRDYNLWVLTELHLLTGAAVLYILWLVSSQSTTKQPNPNTEPPPWSSGRDYKKNTPLLLRKKTDFGFIWMSVPKNYRDSSDDGILTGLLFGPLVSSALLYSALILPSSTNPLPSSWRIEAPFLLNNLKGSYSALEALVLSRYNLVDLSNLCSTILLFHVCASWWLESRYRVGGFSLDGERKSVPRSEGKRLSYFVFFILGTTIGMLGIKFALHEFSLGIWQHLNWLELTVAAMFYQCTLYGAVRLAHRGLTLGELGIVGFGGTALFMEFLNITRARVRSFLTGFTLSPFLILSRHIGQRPVRRMRYPEQKLRQRRLLALGFYVGTFVMVIGLIGMWTYWCLGKRNPWLWVILWLLEGRKQWSRPALLIYWGALGSLSVAGWNRQLARSRKFRAWNSDNVIVPGSAGAAGAPTSFTDGNGNASGSGNSSDTQNGPLTSAGALGLTFPNLPNLPQLSNGVATDILDRADKHVPTLGSNARRKFFHALTVVMFVPGVAFDPAFTHLSFSVAFALFTFAEYVRYFAVYPFGAAVHLFMNEFLDQKDRGTAILSHFYLLTGCAGSIWLEGGSPLLQFTGILVLGVGDALASIVGKRYGVHRWSPTTNKTLEGSFAFTLSVVVTAWILRLFRLTESFSTLRYIAVIGMSSILEALSDQNDNVTLPLFSWCLLVLVGTIS
ncbi:hypothetical protein BT96DRAFT_954008 [Gymnopus androsaceus JB14]|uniref:dolichol kinase n=1 Tax=Gymnopus androsaceus JB14 TaxID=1447944 RepID=A0A6A4ICV3_9AGAR|nr:hypothetical protein BT96DRAFT_954008 [Gymnopus androsaceus JB14]